MLELTITALSHAGEGIGRADGRVVFVPFALPGETVQVEIVEDKAKFARARLLAVLDQRPSGAESNLFELAKNLLTQVARRRALRR